MLATLTGTLTPSDIVATNSTGQLTLRWTTDVSNVGSWGGFRASITAPTPLPVELKEFYAITYPKWNVIKWTTSSENNSSHFDLEMSNDGETWKKIATKQSAGNSTEELKYSYIDYNSSFLTYYTLVQYDIDGMFETYGPIAVTKNNTDKKIIKYINLIGQEVIPETTKGLIIEIYDDGTTKIVIK